jgi:hypothetical protein
MQQMPATFLPLSISQALTGKEPGKFVGTSDGWAAWRRKWLLYLKEVEEMYNNISNRQRLALLRHWVDPATAETLDDELHRDPDMSYDMYWARLDLSFGAEDKEGLRRQLRALRLNHKGKVQEKEWREFAARALCLARQLGDVSETEIGRIMMDGLPVHPWRRKLAEEAEKRAHHGILVLDGLPMDATEEELDNLITLETGKKPFRVRRDGRKVRVTTADESHKETIKMVFDRQQLQGGATVTVAPEAVELSGEEVDKLMLRWLRIDAKINSGGERFGGQAGRDTHTESYMRRERGRMQREIQAHEDDTEGGTQWEGDEDEEELREMKTSR